MIKRLQNIFQTFLIICLCSIVFDAIAIRTSDLAKIIDLNKQIKAQKDTFPEAKKGGPEALAEWYQKFNQLLVQLKPFDAAAVAKYQSEIPAQTSIPKKEPAAGGISPQTPISVAPSAPSPTVPPKTIPKPITPQPVAPARTAAIVLRYDWCARFPRIEPGDVDAKNNVR